MQAHVLGHWYRSKVVHQVRARYEQVVTEIQPNKDFPFADESVTWPSQVGLCYPVFRTICSPNSSSVHEQSHQLWKNSLPDPAVSKNKEEEKEEGELIFNKDRQSLLEMRSKLEMELVWLRQAINSRHKVSVCGCVI